MKRGHKKDYYCVKDFESIEDFKKAIEETGIDIIDFIKKNPDIMEKLSTKNRIELAKLMKKLV